MGFPGGSDGKESACNARDLVLIPWSRRSPRERNGSPLQYSCLENFMDRGVWWAAVHGIAKRWTRLSDFPFTFHFHTLEKEMATHSSVLAWRISGMGEPGGLPSLGSHRVGHDWSDLAAAAAKWGHADLLHRLNSVKYETAQYRRYSVNAHRFYRWDNFASLMVFFPGTDKRIHRCLGRNKGSADYSSSGGKKFCLGQFSSYIFFVLVCFIWQQ